MGCCATASVRDIPGTLSDIVGAREVYTASRYKRPFLNTVTIFLGGAGSIIELERYVFRYDSRNMENNSVHALYIEQYIIFFLISKVLVIVLGIKYLYLIQVQLSVLDPRFNLLITQRPW